MQGTGWERSEVSLYDLRQAVAHMTLQAVALGLSTCQFRAFDRDALAIDFAVSWEVTTMSAVGCPAPGSAPALSTTPEVGLARQRRASRDILWPVAGSGVLNRSIRGRASALIRCVSAAPLQPELRLLGRARNRSRSRQVLSLCADRTCRPSEA